MSGALASFAAEVGAEGPVAVEGGRTAWDVGGPPAGGVRLVSAPAGVVEHVPAEMTVRVGAGTAVTALHDVLADAGQTTLLPDGPGATVGGALAVGQDGIGRLGRGRLRDALLEVRYVSAEGRLVKAGGPTVKNVSGYDLCRLVVGSLGTLGLLGEVVLRTRPVPPSSRWFAGPADPAAVRARLHRPAAVLWDGATSWVWLEGHGVDVEAEGRVLAELGIEPVEGPPPLPAHRHAGGDATPADGARYVAEVGTGIVHRDDPPVVAEPPGPVAALHRRVKQALDPAGRLNPGRDPLRVVA